jgi:hypothetical protein
VRLSILRETQAGAGFSNRAARPYRLSLFAAEELAKSAPLRSCDP